MLEPKLIRQAGRIFIGLTRLNPNNAVHLPVQNV
jgi:hypothetical protein